MVENQSLLNSLLNHSFSSSHDSEKQQQQQEQIDALESQLLAEKSRCSQLTDYLSDCMEANDSVRFASS